MYSILLSKKGYKMTIEQTYKKNRVKLPSWFTLDVLNSECVGCVEIDGFRNIVWEYRGSLYLQECLREGTVFYTTHT